MGVPANIGAPTGWDSLNPVLRCVSGTQLNTKLLNLVTRLKGSADTFCKINRVLPSSRL